MLVGSVNIISAQSVARRSTRHMFFVIGKPRLCDCGCGGFCSTQAIFEVLAWSFSHLQSGTPPTVLYYSTTNIANPMAIGTAIVIYIVAAAAATATATAAAVPLLLLRLPLMLLPLLCSKLLLLLEVFGSAAAAAAVADAGSC